MLKPPHTRSAPFALAALLPALFVSAACDAPIDEARPASLVAACAPSTTVGSRPAGNPIAAASFDEQSGVVSYSSAISHVDDGDWVVYRGVDFGTGASANLFYAFLGTPHAGNRVEVRLDCLDGQKIADLGTTATTAVGGDAFVPSEKQVAAVSSVPTGVHDVYLVFNGAQNRANQTNGWGFGIGNFAEIGFAAGCPAATPTLEGNRCVACPTGSDACGGRCIQTSAAVKANVANLLATRACNSAATCDFHDACLYQADLRGVEIAVDSGNIRFDGADLRGANFGVAGGDPQNIAQITTNAGRIRADGADFSGASFQDTYFSADGGPLRFENAKFDGITTSGDYGLLFEVSGTGNAVFSNTSWTGASLPKLYFEMNDNGSIVLNGADFSGAAAGEIVFELNSACAAAGGNLSFNGANLTGLSLSGSRVLLPSGQVSFANANLTGANLTGFDVRTPAANQAAAVVLAGAITTGAQLGYTLTAPVCPASGF